MAHPVTWFQIAGADGEQLKAFYQQAFGWKMTPAPDGQMGMVAPGEGGIAGGVGASLDGSASVTVYVQVPDLSIALGAISHAGGRVVMQPMELPAGLGWIAGFTDPAGNWVGLWTRPAKPRVRRAAKAKAKVKVKARPARRTARR